MLDKIKAVLKDEQLRQKIQEAKTPDDVIKLLTTAGAQKGYNFKAEDVSKLVTGLALQTIPELSEEDLLNRAGGELRARGTWPISAGVCCTPW
ncbi:MAG: Nif11-like leader peptide family RiPP precursor [Xenococcaceae cyanobacterium MO_188.B32]|nr:Nif11-like leader peptide family RiPP precursor [Xenococcaceae cyanobacterium MO_188.B32]